MLTIYILNLFLGFESFYCYNGMLASLNENSSATGVALAGSNKTDDTFTPPYELFHPENNSDPAHRIDTGGSLLNPGDDAAVLPVVIQQLACYPERCVLFLFLMLGTVWLAHLINKSFRET